MTKYHVALPDSTHEGPFDKETISTKIREGYYKPGCLVWHEEMKEWEPMEKHFPMNTVSSKKKRSLMPKLIAAVLLAACCVGGYAYYECSGESELTIEEANDTLRRMNISVSDCESTLIQLARNSTDLDLKTIKSILIAGNVSQKTKDDAVRVFMYKGGVKQCEVLFDHGADLGKAFQRGFDKDFDDKLLQKFILEYAISHAKTNQWVGAAFVELATYGKKEELKQLLTAGVNINAVDANGRTAMMRAAEMGHKETAKLLLKKGADLKIHSSFGESAMSFACAGAGMGKKNVETLRLLLEHKADVNSVDRNGESCLMTLIKTDANWAKQDKEVILDIAKALIAAGADIHIKDRKGFNAFCWAAYYGNVPMMQLLAELGSVNTNVRALHTYPH